MDIYTATELAYKNGYEKGYADALIFAQNELNTIRESVKECLQKSKALTVFATDNNVGCKWIPVSERLPENFISVLVHIPDMNPCPAVMEAYRFDDGWVTKMAAFDINCATHWMPMPEPPKEE